MAVKISDLIKKLEEVKHAKGDTVVEMGVDSHDNMQNSTLILQCGRVQLHAIGETTLGKAKNFPSKAQIHTLNLIVKYFPELVFTGSSKEEATLFIGEHKHKLPIDATLDKQYYYQFPTPKQVKYIEAIEAKTGIPFEGKTFQEATDYITKNGFNSNNNTQRQAPSFSIDPVYTFEDDDIPF